MRARSCAGLALVLVLGALTAAQAAGPPPLSSGAGPALALARSVVPRAADIPFGWTATKGEPGPGAGCFSVPLKAAHAQAFQISPKLASGATHTQAMAIAAVYSTAQAAASALPRAVAANPVNCMHQVLVEGIGSSSATVEPFVSAPLAFPRIGQSRSATRYRAAVVEGATRQPIFVDIVFVQRLRVVVGVAVIGLDGKPAIADEQALLAQALGRI